MNIFRQCPFVKSSSSGKCSSKSCEISECSQVSWNNLMFIINIIITHSFLKCPSVPCQARVRCLPHEVPPHIPEYCPFRLQPKQFHVIFHALSIRSYCPCPHISLPPPPHFHRRAYNKPHLSAPNVQTTSICHTSPHQPHSEHLEDYKSTLMNWVTCGCQYWKFI